MQLSTKEIIDRIFKEPGIKYELTEFENLGKAIHDGSRVQFRVTSSLFILSRGLGVGRTTNAFPCREFMPCANLSLYKEQVHESVS